MERLTGTINPSARVEPFLLFSRSSLSPMLSEGEQVVLVQDDGDKDVPPTKGNLTHNGNIFWDLCGGIWPVALVVTQNASQQNTPLQKLRLRIVPWPSRALSCTAAALAVASLLWRVPLVSRMLPQERWIYGGTAGFLLLGFLVVIVANLWPRRYSTLFLPLCTVPGALGLLAFSLVVPPTRWTFIQFFPPETQLHVPEEPLLVNRPGGAEALKGVLGVKGALCAKDAAVNQAQCDCKESLLFQRQNLWLPPRVTVHCDRKCQFPSGMSVCLNGNFSAQCTEESPSDFDLSMLTLLPDKGAPHASATLTARCSELLSLSKQSSRQINLFVGLALGPLELSITPKDSGADPVKKTTASIADCTGSTRCDSEWLLAADLPLEVHINSKDGNNGPFACAQSQGRRLLMIHSYSSTTAVGSGNAGAREPKVAIRAHCQESLRGPLLLGMLEGKEFSSQGWPNTPWTEVQIDGQSALKYSSPVVELDLALFTLSEDPKTRDLRDLEVKWGTSSSARTTPETKQVWLPKNITEDSKVNKVKVSANLGGQMVAVRIEKDRLLLLPLPSCAECTSYPPCSRNTKNNIGAKLGHSFSVQIGCDGKVKSGSLKGQSFGGRCCSAVDN